MTLNRTLRHSLIALLATGALAATCAAAQASPVPHHPRVNEVNQRVDKQQHRIDKGVANGAITSKQAARDEKHDANIAQRASAAEARHNGHLTRKETRRGSTARRTATAGLSGSSAGTEPLMETKRPHAAGPCSS